ncbi:leucine-rich repeat domain-containing protein [Bifidobacterium aemilianum]|nr:leucine-rich repeat domain-containing protein [Bifidobacterium aemilianum]
MDQYDLLATNAVAGSPFLHDDAVTVIKLPDKVANLPPFAGCFPTLQELHLSPALTAIPHDAFSGKGILSSLVFAPTSALTLTGALAFAKTAIASLVIPDSVTAIEDKAFSVDDDLTLGSGLKTIGDQDFAANNIGGRLNLPASLLSLGKQSFMFNQPTAVAGWGAMAIDDDAFDTNTITSLDLGPAGLTTHTALYQQAARQVDLSVRPYRHVYLDDLFESVSLGGKTKAQLDLYDYDREGADPADPPTM